MPDEEKLKKINELIQKVDEMKKADKMDLSSDQDLSIAIMNLVSIEEHFFFTGAKTGKPEYYDLAPGSAQNARRTAAKNHQRIRRRSLVHFEAPARRFNAPHGSRNQTAQGRKQKRSRGTF